MLKNIKKPIFVLFAVFLLTMISCDRQNQPYKLKIEPSRIEFGTISVPEDSVVSRSFTIRNTGDSAVHIIRTDVSCDCMHIKGRLGDILPGNTEEYTLSIDLRQLNKGNFSKNVYIRSNTDDKVEIIHVYGSL